MKAMIAEKGSLCIITIAIWVFPYFAFAQQVTGKVPRIGYLSFGVRRDSGDEAFLQGLRNLGHVEGRNISIEDRFAHRNLDLLSQFAAELVGLKVDVIVTTTGQGALRVKKVTSTIPIVVASSSDAVRQGIVASLARPRGERYGRDGYYLGSKRQTARASQASLSRFLTRRVLSCSGFRGVDHIRGGVCRRLKARPERCE
jgi:hypothetical protein